MQVRTNNIQRYEFNTAGQLASFGDGTAALPAYSWTTNTNMGLFRQSLNTLGFSTTGVERMRISNIGNVGIGGVPGVGAILDLQATNKGALLPRVALTSIISNAPIGAAGILQAMMVYNTATAGAAPNNVYPGYYYWDGASLVLPSTQHSREHHIHVDCDHTGPYMELRCLSGPWRGLGGATQCGSGICGIANWTGPLQGVQL